MVRYILPIILLTLGQAISGHQPDISNAIKREIEGGSHDHDHSVSVTVIMKTNLRQVNHFWKSTGFCPPSPHNESWTWFSSDSMTQNLMYMGAVPFKGLRQVRIHWLLDLLTVEPGGDHDVFYNFTRLDHLLDKLHALELIPGFELMGNPGGIFTDFENRTQVFLWRSLVQQVAQHYVNRYGLDHVAVWNFETWNEPKKGHFDNLNMTLTGFLNYYDACAAGLHLVSDRLRLGAPGGECKKYRLDHYCWALLSHISKGRDFFTGMRPKSPDFISIHKKGETPDNTAWILKKEEDTLNDIRSHFISLSKIEVFNDEGDPLVGWNRSFKWRADATYAAIVAKVIVQHHIKWFENQSNVHFGLLSNDNGFLGYQPDLFSQRTLLARFQTNNTDRPYVQMVAKPVFSVLGLLSLLGSQQLQVLNTGNFWEKANAVGVLASRTPGNMNEHQSDEYSLLMYHSYDTHNISITASVNLSFTECPLLTDARIVVYQLDNHKGNPYQKWVDFGQPPVLSRRQMNKLQKEELPKRIIGPEVFHCNQSWKLALPHPAVALVQVCSKPKYSPPKVTDIFAHRINDWQLLITWNTSNSTTKCLLTYIVTLSNSGKAGTYRRVTKKQTIFNYAVVDLVTMKGRLRCDSCFLRVTTVDIWWRKGQPSNPIQVKPVHRSDMKRPYTKTV